MWRGLCSRSMCPAVGKIMLEKKEEISSPFLPTFCSYNVHYAKKAPRFLLLWLYCVSACASPLVVYFRRRITGHLSNVRARVIVPATLSIANLNTIISQSSHYGFSYVTSTFTVHHQMTLVVRIINNEQSLKGKLLIANFVKGWLWFN